MVPQDQHQAQERVDRIAAFRAELAELERERALTLTEDQRARLAVHHEEVLATLSRRSGAAVHDTVRRISWGMRVATFLGGAAFFAALVLFLHRFWAFLPSWAQAVVLVVCPLLFLGAAEWTFRRPIGSYYTALLALAAGVSFVMGLTSLAGTLNLAPSPHALLAWAAMGILLAYAYGLRLALAAGLVLACAYTAALWVAADGGHWANFMQRTGGLIPAAGCCYALPSLRRHCDPRGFDFVYRFCGAATALLALLLLSQRGDLAGLGLSSRAVQTLCQVAGMVGSVAVVFHGLHLGKPGLVNLGAAAFVVFLFVRLHAWWWAWMPKYLFFGSLGFIAVALLLLFRRTRARLSERAEP